MQHGESEKLEHHEHHGIMERMKEGISHLGSTISHKIHDLKERVKPHGEHHELSDEELHHDLSTLQTLSMENLDVSSVDVFEAPFTLAQLEMMEPEKYMTHIKGSWVLEAKGYHHQSSGLLTKGLIKASDIIAEGFGTIMNLVLPENLHEESNEEKLKQIGEKVDEKKQEIKENIQELPEKASEKVSELKEKAEEKVEGAKQTLQESKEQASQKLQEGKESLESKGQELKQQGQEISGKASEKVQEAKDKLSSGELGEEEEINPQKDLDESVKKQIEKINDEIEHRPHMKERVIETRGKGHQEEKGFEKAGEKKEELQQKGKELESKGKNIVQDMSNKASEKVEELKGKASQKVENLKQGAQQASKEASQQLEQGKEGLKKKSEEGQVSEDISRKIHDLADKFTGHGQEGHQGHEGHEHHEHHEHHLTLDSRSFKPTEESKILTEKVIEGLEENSAKLNEKIEEAEHILEEKHKHQGKHQSKRKGSKQEKGQQQHQQQKQQQPQKSKEPHFEKAEDVEKMLEKEAKTQQGQGQGKSSAKKAKKNKKKSTETIQPQEKEQKTEQQKGSPPQQVEHPEKRKYSFEGRRQPYREEIIYVPKHEQHKESEQQKELPQQKEQQKQGQQGQGQEAEHKESPKQVEHPERRKYSHEGGNGGNRNYGQRHPYREEIIYVPKHEQHKESEQQKELPQQKEQQKQGQKEQIEAQKRDKFFGGSVPEKDQSHYREQKEVYGDKEPLNRSKPLQKDGNIPGPVDKESKKESSSQQKGEQTQEERIPLVDKLAQNISKKIEGIKGVFKIDENQQEKGKERRQEQEEEREQEPRRYEKSQEGQEFQKGSEAQERIPIVDKFNQGYQDMTTRFYEKAGNVILKEKELKEEASRGLHNIKAKFSHGGKEAKEELGQKEEQIKEQGRSFQQEAQQNLEGAQGKLSEKKEEATETGHSAKERLQEGIHNLREKMSHKSTEAKEDLGQKGEQIKEQEPLQGKLKGKVQEGILNLGMKMAETSESFKNKLREEKEKITHAGESISQKIQGGAHEVSEKISEGTEAAKSKLGFNKESKEGQESQFQQPSGNIDEAPTRKIKPTELKEFTEVKEGFSESVSEFKQEKRLEELGREEVASTNPFEPLIGAKNIVQPLLPTEVVGGNLQEMVTEEKVGADITNLQEEENIGGKTFKDKIKEAFHDVDTRLQGTKEKVKSTFQSKDKENVPLDQ